MNPARKLPPLGAKQVEEHIRLVMERASWNQDVLDAVLRALELPFASRRLCLRMEPITEMKTFDLSPPERAPLPRHERMTEFQWSIVSTIHIQPDYRFTGFERRAAERMMQRGWLRPGEKKTFAVTKKGETVYRKQGGKHAKPHGS